MRKVHVDTQEWEYEIGKRVVVIHPPIGKKVIVNFQQLFGKDVWDRMMGYIEDADYEGSGRIPITPSVVKRYIEENLK